MEAMNRTKNKKQRTGVEKKYRWMRSALLLVLVLAMTFGMSNRASDLSGPVRAEQPGAEQPAGEPKAVFAVEFMGSGWTDWAADNSELSRAGSYPTAFKAGLQNQPAALTGTIQYQVNVSGSGWSGTYENGAVAGAEGGNAPLEAVRVWLNGDLAVNYDLYAKALVNGQWLDWAVNGQDAGKAGVGTHIDGIRIAMVKKGTVPAEPPVAAVSAKAAGSAVDPSKPMVALTFDDGPSRFDNRILASLEAVGGRATFFMVGYLVPGHKPVVERMIADGCELGNHSWRHENLSKLSAAEVKESLQKTNDAIAAIAGHPATVVRPPYGATGGQAKATIGAMGYASVLWSIDTLDWKTKSVDNTVNVVLSQIKDGDIVLMHSIYGQSAEAAEKIIPELVKRGYQLVTVSELANARGGMTAGKSYGAFR